MKNIKKNKKASGVLEFLVVFIILFLFFMIITDLGLFFRQIYVVQTMSDETLARLQSEHLCSNRLAETAAVMTDVVHKFHGSSPRFQITLENNAFAFSGDRHVFSMMCKNPRMVDKLNLTYQYRGIFIFSGGRSISSNFSSNSSYY